VKDFRLRPLDDTADFDLVWNWMNKQHVDQFWNLAGPPERLRRYLDSLNEAGHSQPMIGEMDGRPMSYWEIYWAARDPLAAHYVADPADQGVHLLIGEPEDTGKGLGTYCLSEVTRWMLEREPKTRRVIAEPDVRNQRVLKTFERCGYRKVKEIDLPDKRAALVIHERGSA